MKKIKRKTAIFTLLIFVSFLFVVSPVKMVNAYFSSFTIIADGKKYLFYPPEIVYGLNGLNMVGIDKVVEKIANENQILPTDATVKFNPDSEQIFTFIKEKSGKRIDENKLKKKIERAFLVGERVVEIKSENVKAENTVEMLKAQTHLVSQFSTEYTFSTTERKSNIALATSFISGFVLKPGQTFSFNEVVGIRSEERGFLTAKIIVDGKFVDGVGGGVCQVSTTLYNAVLMAGIKADESHNHSLRVDYVKPSFDAMVSDYFSDLKFTNNNQTPLYIAGYADGEKLTFKIYGKPTNLRYELLSSVVEVIEAKTVTEKKVTGEEVDVYPKNGLKSEGYLCVYDGEVLIEKIKLRSDTYKARDGIIYYE